jgi:hypothetical protein
MDTPPQEATLLPFPTAESKLLLTRLMETVDTSLMFNTLVKPNTTLPQLTPLLLPMPQLLPTQLSTTLLLPTQLPMLLLTQLPTPLLTLSSTVKLL